MYLTTPIGESASPYVLEPYEPAYLPAWTAFAKAHGSIFHSIEWREVLQETFGYEELYFVVVDRNQRLAGLLPLFAVRTLSFRRVGISLPFTAAAGLCCHGPVASSVLQRVPEVLERCRLGYVELRLRGREPLETKASVNTENATFRLAVGSDDDSVLARSSAAVRRHTRRVYAEKRFASSSEWRKLGEFYEVFRRRQHELGSPAPGIGLFHKIKEKFPNQTTLLTVLDQSRGNVLGGMFLLADQDTVYYLWGAADRDYNRHYINHFMYSEAIRLARQRGNAFLDMGRSPETPSRRGSYGFKMQFGAEPVPLYYYRVGSRPGQKRNPQVYLRPLTAMWRRLPASAANFLGKRLIKFIAP